MNLFGIAYSFTGKIPPVLSVFLPYSNPLLQGPVPYHYMLPAKEGIGEALSAWQLGVRFLTPLGTHAV